MSEIKINEGTLRKRITYLIFWFRLFLLAALLYLEKTAALTTGQFFSVLYIILPNCVLYLVFFSKYISVTTRYFEPGAVLNKSYFLISITPIILLHLTETGLLLFRQYLFNDLEIMYLFTMLSECLLSVYAGLHLSKLFSAR